VASIDLATTLSLLRQDTILPFGQQSRTGGLHPFRGEGTANLKLVSYLLQIRRFSSQQVQHENIIRLICTYVAQTKVFIVTELASGGELLQRISDAGSFSEKDACAVVSQILKGVEYLHKRNIVHRDLKLENIMLSNLTPQAKVKIADFGLARYFADDSQLRTICGSPLYVAPEILDIGTNSETVENSSYIIQFCHFCTA